MAGPSSTTTASEDQLQFAYPSLRVARFLHSIDDPNDASEAGLPDEPVRPADRSVALSRGRSSLPTAYFSCRPELARAPSPDLRSDERASVSRNLFSRGVGRE